MRSEVQLLPGPPFCVHWYGALAQLGERLLCKHQVIGSIPIGSTIFPPVGNDAVVEDDPYSRNEDSGLHPLGCNMGLRPLFDIVNGFF